MSLHRAFLWLWIGGLVLFAGVIALGLPLGITAVPGGILDHQAAGTAAEIDRIQHAWADAGLLDRARIAMLGDLVFIGVYGLGSLLGGLWMRRDRNARVRGIGVAVAIAALVFLVTDYVETVCQLIQLVRFEGDDALAGVAASVRPVKIAAWLVTFFGTLAGLYRRRKSARNA